MRYLILINQAPNYFYFYNQLAKELVQRGNEVFYAVSSHLPAVLYDFEETDLKVFFFSEFFKENYDLAKLPENYRKYNLWEMFFSDFERYEIYGHHLRNDKVVYPKIIINLFCFFEEIINSQKIDTVIYENVSNSFAYSAYFVSKELNKKYFGLSFPRIPGRFEIITSEEGNKQLIKQNYDAITNGLLKAPEDIEKTVNNYISNFLNYKPQYMVNNLLSSRYNILSRYINLSRIKFYLKLLKYRIKYPFDNKYNYQAPVFSLNFGYFKRNIKRKIKLLFIKKYLKEFEPINQFYFYPIHFHPEASTSVAAKSYVNEYHNILNISLNIPFGEYLYVKDHESSVGYPSIIFYKKVSKIPNVILISHKYNAKEIIKRAKAVLTITSTVGFEAIVLNKPIFVFGNVFYDFHPLCTKVYSFDSLFPLIKNLKEPKQYNPSDFLNAYYMSTYEGVIRYIKNLNSEDELVIKKIVDLICNYEKK